MWLGAASSISCGKTLCFVAHGWKRHCLGPVLDSLCTAALVRARTARRFCTSRLAVEMPWLPAKGGARNKSTLEETSRALPRPFFVPGDSRILGLPQLERPALLLRASATRQQIAFSRVSTIALNAPKRLSPQKRRGCTAELQLWQCSPCGGHTCRTTRARYRGASRSHRAAAHALKCSPSRKTRATRTR